MGEERSSLDILAGFAVRYDARWRTTTGTRQNVSHFYTEDFKPISADEIKAQRGKNLTKEQGYQFRKELKRVK